MLAHALLAFFFLQLPQKDAIPQRVGGHTTLNRKVYCNLSLYWLHSGFYNHSKDRLQSEMTIAKGLKLLKSIFQEFLLCHTILEACQKVVKLVLNKKIDDALIKGSSSTCVGYHYSKRLKQ